MARGLDERQQAELSAFVNAIAERAGYTTTAEWARDAGYPASNLSNLRNGRSAVDGYNLLRLIQAAAARSQSDPSDLALAQGVTMAEMRKQIADLETGLTELSHEIRRALESPAVDGSAIALSRTP